MSVKSSIGVLSTALLLSFLGACSSEEVVEPEKVKEVVEVVEEKEEVIEVDETVDLATLSDEPIPNTILPNQHGLPVAIATMTDDVFFYVKSEDGTLVRNGILSEGTDYFVVDYEDEHYVLDNGSYVPSGSRAVITIGKGEVRLPEVPVFNSEGVEVRKLTQGSQYSVYSYDSESYDIGNGESIKIQEGVTFIYGWIDILEDVDVVDVSGKVVKKLKQGDRNRVYSLYKDYINVGDGLRVEMDKTKFKFLKF